MSKDGLFGFVDEFYRAKQSSGVLILLAEKNTDITSSLLRILETNRIEIPEGIRKMLGETEALLRRIADINSLPIHELLRLPPVELSPNTQHPFKSPGDATEYRMEFCCVSG
jgi:hypothetical protein